MKKRDFPVEKIRRYLEPGPIVLVSSARKDMRNIMTMGWHTVMEFTPSLVGGIVSDSNYSFDLIRDSGECVINIPDAGMIDTVTGIGTSSGYDCDKFDHFGLTPVKASKVGAPMIGECFMNLECRLYDDRMVKKYNFFIFKVLKAHVATGAGFPKTLHYRGDGKFTTDAGKVRDRKSLFGKMHDGGNF